MDLLVGVISNTLSVSLLEGYKPLKVVDLSVLFKGMASAPTRVPGIPQRLDNFLKQCLFICLSRVLAAACGIY